jgi:hypothetical protein
MVRVSSAANRHGLRIAALAVAAAVIALVPTAARPAPRANPLFQVTPHELRLSKPVLQLAADHGRAAFVFCQQLVGVWRPGSQTVVRLGRLNLWSCPSPTGAESIQTLAIARDRIAWALDESGNIVDNYVFVTTLANPHTLTQVVNLAHCCRGQADQERIGWVFGDNRFIAFGTRYKCGEFNVPPCTTPPPPAFANYSTWRIRRPPFTSTNCVYKTGPCERVASSPDRLEPLSVGGNRVALLRADGSVVVRDWDGLVLRTFTGLAGLTHGAEVMGGRLVVLIQAHILDFDLTTGRQLHSILLPTLPNAGVCGILPCLPTALRMLDAARGLVVYTLAGKLHELRLRDGADAVVAAADDARFGDTGLFYSFTTTGSWPGRIRFVRWAALPLQP